MPATPMQIKIRETNDVEELRRLAQYGYDTIQNMKAPKNGAVLAMLYNAYIKDMKVVRSQHSGEFAIAGPNVEAKTPAPRSSSKKKTTRVVKTDLEETM